MREELECFRAERRDNSTLLFGLATLAGWLARSAPETHTATLSMQEPLGPITTRETPTARAERVSRP